MKVALSGTLENGGLLLKPLHTIRYKLDTCGPIFVTIGDGGNIEGPYRNFVDQINPNTNKTASFI